jgi:protein phosphatase
MSVTLPLSSLKTASLSDVGRVRSENQDAFADLQRASGERLLVVADGMGGHRGGSVASQLAVQAMDAVFQRGDLSGAELLITALSEANRCVHEAALEDPALSGMGTTAVAVLLEGRLDGAWIAHVGDSRIYRARNGQLEQLTEDHSAVAELLRRGVINEEEAETHPRRNEILRSLGILAEVEPTVTHVDLREGDQLLLCSDGLSGVLSAGEIASVLQRAEPETAVRMLVDSVNSRGAPDNVTVVIASVPEEEITDLVGIVPEPTSSLSASRRDVRWVAAAAAVVAAALAVVLAILLLQGDWGARPLPAKDLAAPVEAGPDVAAPPFEGADVPDRPVGPGTDAPPDGRDALE